MGRSIKVPSLNFVSSLNIHEESHHANRYGKVEKILEIFEKIMYITHLHL